ncbi:TetR family transcriptional regulator [Streptomyces sp. 1114.5]|uniref:ScbR family autoregulator-binding transcription factor n=1 Tax=unclassified Streptomyces TaxID=2593676 RepID=UPI000BC9792C|nr:MULTISPECIES: ScbR family autoregulator-binding transcription factor [unclassified Streptomyces]RKT17290.1 TetR family transcriptional regulator [Streptomyces sp. 1114.5]SOB83497.1 transcriptional regulator, TetR family [Streptomyces sp. 1331.2]
MVKQERAGRTRQAVLLAAAETFARVGFEAASLVDISRRAGVSKGALYFHFVSKQALADGVRRAAGREIGSAALRALRADGPALQGLIDLSHELARMLREDVVVRAGVRLGRRGPSREDTPGAPPGPDATWRSLTAVVQRLLDRAAEAGELHPGVDRRAAAELLTSVAAGQVLLAGEEGDRPRPEAVRRVWTAALPALVAADRRAGYRL